MMSKSASAVVLAIVAVPFIAVATLIALWTDRTLEFWLSHIKGYPVEVPLLIDFLCLLLGPINLLLNVVSEVARLAV